jgi:hypothetical protein
LSLLRLRLLALTLFPTLLSFLILPLLVLSLLTALLGLLGLYRLTFFPPTLSFLLPLFRCGLVLLASLVTSSASSLGSSEIRCSQECGGQTGRHCKPFKKLTLHSKSLSS